MAHSPTRSSRRFEIILILALMLFGSLYLVNKVNKPTPTQFSAQNLPKRVQALAVRAEENLQNADLSSLVQAKIALTTLISQVPDYPPARGQLALTQALLAQRMPTDRDTNWSNAKQAARAVLLDFPDEIHGLLALARVQFYRDKDINLAEKTLRHAMKQQPKNLFGLSLLADFSAQRGKYKLAARFGDTIALQNPNANWLLMYACRNHAQAKQWTRAAHSCKRVLGKDPKHLEALQILKSVQAHLPAQKT